MRVPLAALRWQVPDAEPGTGCRLHAAADLDLRRASRECFCVSRLARSLACSLAYWRTNIPTSFCVCVCLFRVVVVCATTVSLVMFLHFVVAVVAFSSTSVAAPVICQKKLALAPCVSRQYNSDLHLFPCLCSRQVSQCRGGGGCTHT